jgi:hypothetical protein
MSLFISQISVPSQHTGPLDSLAVFDLGDLRCLESHLKSGALDLGVSIESSVLGSASIVFPGDSHIKTPCGLFVSSNSAGSVSGFSRAPRS